MDMITGWVAAAGYVGVFALMFLENLFPPIPSEFIMPLAGFVAAKGELSLGGVVIAGVAGTLVGNAVWFEGARSIGTERTKALCERYGRWMGVTRADLDSAEMALKRWGPLGVFVGRMMPGIRTVISVPAGLIEMPRRVFYAWTTLGSFLWVGGLAVLGFILGESFRHIEGYVDPVGKLLIVTVGLLFLWQLWRVWRRPR